MPDHTKWMAFRLAIVTVVLGMAFAWTVAASAYDTVGPATTAATAEASASPDAVRASAGGGPAMGQLRVTLDMDGDGGWHMGSGWWIVMPIMMVVFWGGYGNDTSGPRNVPLRTGSC